MKIIGLAGTNQAQRGATVAHLAEAHGFAVEATLWTSHTLIRYARRGESVVVSNVRDETMAQLIHNAGGQIWHFGGNATECPPDERDQVLTFDGDERLFFPLIDKALEHAPEAGCQLTN